MTNYKIKLKWNQPFFKQTRAKTPIDTQYGGKNREREREIHYHTKGLQENYDFVYHYTKVSNL